ncbi:TPA: Ni/Fe-hydrogenase cytochrome b subunit [Candidatus Poribacteria bacterium]|nr:Ni/Fe-hydrogenase cytochrome b subunit [Candidatus Poribacteria bacterium]
MGLTIGEYIKRNITPFNIVAALILAVGLPVTVIRFAKGLGAATNLSDTNPWGLWIGFDVLCGVALAAGGFTISSAVYLFGLKKYHPIVRPAILTGFLGYFLVVVGLLFDLGRPWRLPYPIFVSQGTTSVMFEVALCVALYLTVLFIEFSPAALEWLGLKRLRGWVVKMTIALTILGLILSTMHQSSLGALFLIAPGKLHPLWYSPFIPVFFFVSAIIAGLSMVIFESMLSHRAFSNQIEHHDNKNFDELIIGLGKAASIALLSYFGLKWLGVIDGNHWGLLNTRMGYWFLVEVFVFVLLPAFLYAWGVREQNANIIRFTAIFTVAGIILNRINVSIIAFNWNAEVRYFPRWMEFAVTITIITFGLLMFRWIANRMPILYEHADYKDAH